MRKLRFLTKLRWAVWIYILGLIIRLISLDTAGIYSDEITWMVRGKEVVYAILHRNSSYFDNAWWNKQNDTEAIGLPLVVTSGIPYVFLSEGGGRISLKVLPEIVAARIGPVMVNAILPVGILIFGIYFLSFGVGLLAALVYMIDPVTLGLDRWVVHDSFLTLFSFGALASFLIYGEKGKLNILPGILLGLAFLTKPNGIVPFVGWITYWLFNFKSKQILKLLLLNCMIFFATITILWPASWHNPLAFLEYLWRQTSLVQGGMRNFYLGEVTNDPGWTYFIFQILTKMPEVLILGMILGILNVVNFRKKNRSVFIASLSYVLVFFVLISVSPKKLGARYALPLFPWLILLSSYGLVAGFKLIKSRKVKIILIGLALFSLLYPLTFAPDYYQYYNLFVGGPKGAQKYDLVGFCASSRPAFEYLNEINFDGKVYVAGCADPVAYYSPQAQVVDDFREAEMVVVETYLKNQHPEDPVWRLLEGKSPDKQFKNHGAVMTEIYVL